MEIKNSLTDNELIEAFQEGNLDAFDLLVERYNDLLMSYFYRCVRNRQTAEDYTQEIFIKLATYLEQYEPKAQFKTFLYRIARNFWIDRIRSMSIRPKSVSLETPTMGGESTIGRMVRSEQMAPDRLIESEETGSALDAMIKSLPEHLRLVFVMSEIEGMRYREIGERLDIPIGTVKSRMHTAVMRLRELAIEGGMNPKEEYEHDEL